MADVVVSVPVFSTKVTDSLLSYQQNSILCDCSIICSDESVPAHQIILTIWGYQSMFQEKTEICANTYTAQDIRLFLKFLYTGKMSIPPQEVQKLSDIAKILGICLTTFETKCYMPSSINSTETLSYPVNVVSLNDFIENMDSKRDIESESPYPVLLSKVEETSINKAASTEELSDIKVEAVDIEFDMALGEKCPYEGTVLPDATTHSSEFQNTCLGRSLLNSSVLSKRKNKTNTCEGSKKKKGERALVEEPVSNSDTSEPVEEPENSDPVEEHDSVVAEVHPTSDTVKIASVETGNLEYDEQSTTEDKLDPLYCNICEKSFKWRNSFLRHRKIHTAEAFCCGICNKTFKVKPYLTEHIKRVHQIPLKVHLCPYCGRKFKTASTLSAHASFKHLNIHKSCELCSYKGRDRYALERHMKTHENEYQQCSKCKRFVKHLKPHLENCSGTKKKKRRPQYDCDTCGQKFLCKRYLKRHVRHKHFPEHEGYTCSCGKHFQYYSSLQRHAKQFHFVF